MAWTASNESLSLEAEAFSLFLCWSKRSKLDFQGCELIIKSDNNAHSHLKLRWMYEISIFILKGNTDELLSYVVPISTKETSLQLFNGSQPWTNKSFMCDWIKFETLFYDLFENMDSHSTTTSYLMEREFIEAWNHTGECFSLSCDKGCWKIIISRESRHISLPLTSQHPVTVDFSLLGWPFGISSPMSSDASDSNVIRSHPQWCLGRS